MVKHLPHISIEKYAAYLDGNLPDEEMIQIEAFIEKDTDMQAFLKADDNIDSNFDLDLFDSDSISLDETLASLELPSLDTVTFEQNGSIEDFFSSEGDRPFSKIESIFETMQDGFPVKSDYMDDNSEIEGVTAGEEISEHIPFDLGIDPTELPSFEEGSPFDQDGVFDELI